MLLPRRRWRLALAVLASAFAAPSLCAQILRPDKAPAPEVTAVEFNGVTKAIDLRELQANIYTEPTRCRIFLLAPVCRFANWRAIEARHYLNRQELKRDVLRIRVFYYREGYREAQVDTTVTQLNDRQVAVRFNITEGQPTIVTDVSIAYDSTLLTPKRVQQLNLVEIGRPLDMFEVDSTRIQFQNELWELGYADALVDTSTVVDQLAHTARVQVRLVKNHLTTVGDVVILGASQVSEHTVLNSLSFRTGDLFRRSKVLESQRNLYESNLFKLAAIDVPETFDSVKTVNVLLREAQLHEARIGGGFNTVDFLQTEGRYTAYNLFGGARRLDVSATAGNLLAGPLNQSRFFHRQEADTTITGDATDFLKPTYQASVELKQPAWLQRPRDAIAIGAFTQRRAVPAVVIDNGYGGNLTFTHTLAPRAPASLSYRFEVTRVEASGPYFCVNFGVCDTTSINGLRGHQRLSPLLGQIQVDRSDDPLSPSRGYRASAEFEHASSFTVSDYRYNRAYGEGTIYLGLGGKKSVLASRLRIGFVRPLAGGGTLGDAVLHPRKRFYAGGSQSVRGYGENQLGPRILTLPIDSVVSGLTASGAPCDTRSEAVRFCDPNTIMGAGGPLKDNVFTPRPLGGTSLIEGSIEWRFPLSFIENLGGAVFVDGAAVGERVLDPLGAGVSTLANLVRGTGAITPGIGVRYQSSVGPIRVDLGFNPSRTENLAVVTDVVKNGKREIIPLDIPKRYSPTGTSTGIGSILNRFTLHLSIGQAY
ncbi:MAG: BamA/TamA family outer membrane protein [Gemmatimonadota bacterium]|nr:BamA/TamA family outer membrane protein [Gemmatimonadota bacterium]